MSLNPAGLLVKRVTPEEVYTAKFEWLMRWAMHFCANDRQAAEDLVQDTFTQMLSSWERIRNLDQPEQFLYSCLRYGFLRQRRLERRILMEGLTSVDYDSMLVSARQARGQETEWQNELRRVVTFLCWRKEAIKSAGFLLLRFFHGFFPAEIAKIAIVPRTAVYDAIDYARRETKAYLNEPKKLQVLRRGGPLLPKPALPVPTEQFVEEMSKTIFDSCRSACLPPVVLLRRYENGEDSPIDTQLLAHLASCRICLDLVCRRFELPLTGSRTLEESLSPAPRANFGAAKESAAKLARARSLRMAQMRSEEALRHRPRELILFVNGSVVAARDVRSTVSELAVELKGDLPPEFLEVSSEQELILLSAMVESKPPMCPPEQVFHAELVDGRSLQLSLSFGASGVQVRLRYVDPLYRSPDPEIVNATGGEATNPIYPRAHRARSLVEILRGWLDAWATPALMTAVVVLSVMWGLSLRHKPEPALNAHSVLAHALQTVPGTGVQQQTVRIGTRDGSVVVTLHRDLARRRQPRRDAVPGISPKLQGKLELAGMSWSDPLSAASFHAWRAQQANLTDSLESKNGLIVLTTKVNEGTVRASSLTLRESDWRVVARTASFDDGELVDIAELDYSVIPWERSSPDWFEAIPAQHLHLPAATSKPHAEVLPSSPELDEAELGVMLALARIGADTSERISVNRRARDISVTGLVATESRQDEIRQALAGMRYVTTSVLTFSEFDDTPNKPLEAPKRLTVSGAPSAPSAFDRWLLQQQYSLPEVTRMHDELLNAASEMRHTENAQSLLEKRIDRIQLTPAGKARYDALRRLYLDRIAHANAAEATLLQQLHMQASAQNASEDPRSGLMARADENAAICLRLLSGNSETQEDAQALLQRLAYERIQLEAELRSATNESTRVSFQVGSSNETPLD